MATSLNKIVFQTPVVNAFNADGTVNTDSFYKNENKESNKDIIVKVTELEKKPTTELKNFVSYKLQKDIGDFQRANIPEDSLNSYRKSVNLEVFDFLKTQSVEYFISLDSGEVQEIESSLSIPLELKNKNFSTTLGFIIYKTIGNFEQKIYIENDSKNKIDPLFYYDKQFMFPVDYYASYIANVVLEVRNKKTTIKVSGPNSQTIIEKPYFIPRIPSISVYSYQNISNKLLLSLSKNIGDEITKANSLDLFTDEQKNFFKTTIEQKGATYTSDLIYSVGTGKEKYFIIYRIDDKKPETYAEIVIENNIIKKLDIEKLETSVIDNIIPNKKYYYCFRTQDIDGAYSDVSLIYEVEIIDQSGTIYMVQNVFKPEKKIEFIKQLDFENRVRVYPTRAQIIVPDKLTSKKFAAYVNVLVAPSQSTKFSLNDLSGFLGNATLEVSKGSGTRRPLIVNGKTKIIDFTLPFIESSGESLYQEIKKLTVDNYYLDLYSLLINKIIKNPQSFLDTGVVTNVPNLKFSDFFTIIESYDPSYLIEVVVGQFSFRTSSTIATNAAGFGVGSYSIKDLAKDLVIPIGIDNNIQQKYLDVLNDTYNKSAFQNFKSSDLVSKDSIFDSNKIFKARIQSQNSKKKFDLNINYTIEIVDGIKLLKDTTITKNFDILKTEGLT